MTSVLTLLTPVAAYGGIWWLVAVRVLEGVGEGVTLPAMQAMMAKWLPLPERSSLAAFIFAGT